MKRKTVSKTALALGMLTGMGFGPAAFAQTAAAPSAPVASETEVIVTARKREERLIDVPISMQVYDAEELSAAGVTDIRDLSVRSGFQLTPQVSTGPSGRAGGNIIFRGLQASSFGQIRDNSGSLFVDGIYVSGGQQAVDTSDVERVEVLKGPQNAFFGRGTFGGAVNFITRNPGEKYAGQFNVQASDIDSFKVDGNVEGAIIPGLLTGRLSVLMDRRGAQNYADDGGALGEEESRAVTGTLYLTPTSDLWLKARVHYQVNEDSGANIGLLRASVFGGSCAGKTFPGFNGRTGTGPITLGRNYFCNGIPSQEVIGTAFVTQNTVVPAAFATALTNNAFGATGTQRVRFLNSAPDLDHYGLKQEYLNASLQGGYQLEDNSSLEFNFGINESHILAISDIDRTNVNGFLEAQVRLPQDITFDARYISDPNKRLRYLVGASYFAQKERIGQASQNFGGTPSVGVTFQNDTTESPAVYGSIDFDLLDSLTLTVDGRYQEDTITIKNVADVEFQKKEDYFLPRASISFHPQENINLYATYAEGRQPPSGNTGYASLTAAQQAYVQTVFPGVGTFSITPELESYEIGLKHRLNSALSYSVAVYQMDWSNAVTTSSLFNPSSCFVAPVTSLTAACPLAVGGTSVATPNDAEIRGVEVSVAANITANWQASATIDYKDTEWKRYANTSYNAFAGLTGAGDVYRADGNSLARVPDYQGTLSSTYTIPLGDDWEAYVRGDLIYVGKAWDSELNIVETDAYTRVNSRIGMVRGNVTAEIYANNLFEDENWDYAALTVALEGDFTQRALLVQPAPVREVGARLSFKF